MTTIYPVRFYGTIKLIDAFQEKAGIPTHRQAVDAMLMISRSIVSDARAGLKYKIEDKSSCTYPINELFEGNLDSLRDRSHTQRDIVVDLRGVDPVHVAEVTSYMDENRIKPRNTSEALMVAIMVAKAMYDQYGTEKTGEMHIPAIYPGKADMGYKSHIYLKP
jgi:hypothetical protein